MTLVDTSVWIDYFRKQDSPAVARLLSLLEAQEAVAVCPPVLQEILQGAINKSQLEKFWRYFSRVPCLTSNDNKQAALVAARLFLDCRLAGYTVRSSNDCLIAGIAMEHRVALLHDDRDFTLIARIVPDFRQTNGKPANPTAG